MALWLTVISEGLPLCFVLFVVLFCIWWILSSIAIEELVSFPVSILYKSIAGRYRPVRVADGPITARYRFIKNAIWVAAFLLLVACVSSVLVCFLCVIDGLCAVIVALAGHLLYYSTRSSDLLNIEATRVEFSVILFV